MEKNNKVRVRWTTSVNPDLLEMVKELSENSRIPVSRLTDEALELLLIQHKVMKPKATAPKKSPAKKAAAGDPPAGSPHGGSKA